MRKHICAILIIVALAVVGVAAVLVAVVVVGVMVAVAAVCSAEWVVAGGYGGHTCDCQPRQQAALWCT